jgi:hypothetical protein
MNKTNANLLMVVVVVREEFCTFTIIGPGLVIGGGQLPCPIVVTATVC